MSCLFAYPAAAKFGRVLPKNKIYERAKPSPKLKALFVEQVGQMVWQYKLATETLHLAATETVAEIQVFSMSLKTGELHTDVLRCIDQAIPSPILFELLDGNKVQVMAAYKRPSEADSSRWVVGEYFASEWLPADSPRQPLPVVLDLGGLYGRLLSALLPFAARPDESLQAQVARLEVIRSKQRELEKCQSRLRQEKQFNRRVAINAELRTLTQALNRLMA